MHVTRKASKVPSDGADGTSGLDERAAHSTDGRGASRTVLILVGLSLALNLLAGGAYLGSSYFATQRAKPNLVDRRFADLAHKLDVDAATDPGMLALPALTILGAALLTALPPVIRAVRIDPATTLRAE